MAWPASPEYRAALDSTERKPTLFLQIWTDGPAGLPTEYSYMVEDWSVERNPQDTPEQASRFAGSVAASATITLNKQSPSLPDGRDTSELSRDLTPYVGTSTDFLENDFGIGMRVFLGHVFQTTAGPQYLAVFEGVIDRINVRDDGALVLSCLDSCAKLLTKVDLPVMAVDDDSVGFPVYMIVEFLLRSGGFYRTPPPLADCVLSVPGLLPEIGSVGGLLMVEPNPIANFGRYPAPSFNNRYAAITTYNSGAANSPTVVIEGWWRTPGGFGGTDSLVRIAAADGEGPWGLQMSRMITTGKIAWAFLDGTNQIITNAVLPGDNTWHYVYAEIAHTPTGPSWYIRVDDTVTTGTSATSLVANDNMSTIIELDGLVHEGVQIRFTTQAKAAAARAVYRSWTPNYTADVRGVSPTIRAIPRGQSGKAMELLRSIATGTGAVYRFTERNGWRWEERASWVARRVAASVADFDETRALVASGYSYSAASRQAAVEIDYREFRTLRSTVALPAWKTTELIVIGAARTDVLDFETDQPITALYWAIQTDQHSDGFSTFQAVPAYQVGDPAAATVSGVLIRLAPTSTGFRAWITNPSPQPIALWDPNTGEPSFSIQGTTVIGGEPRVYTALASPSSTETLTLPESPWRQVRSDATSMADAIAAEVATPAVVFESQQIQADPTITVDDVARIRAPRIMNSLVPCQIIGMGYANETYSLTVRACYPPRGAVIGVLGRSELNSNAILVV